MVNMYLKTFVFLCFFNIVFSQTLDIRDIDRLSNNQLDSLKEKLLDEQNISEDDNNLEEELNTLDKVKLDIDTQTNTKDLNQNFGYNYFKREINFFDNIPTPPEFKIGPGDEIVLYLWGETNIRKSFVINRDGSIFYENIGFINLSNKTLNEAELTLSNRLSEIYSTINEDNKTRLMLELGKIKSINVYSSGETESPGINLIHPFSDIFTAISQIGIKESGSLRNIELIRNNKVIETFDFYSFFASGKQSFSDTRIMDGDTIHIPVVKKRVKIQNGVVRPNSYELKDKDSLLDLIKYAGGLTSTASNKATLKGITPIKERISDDSAKLAMLISLSDASTIFMNDGAIVNILPIADNNTEVTVYGRVTLPGQYPLKYLTNTSENQKVVKVSTLKDVLNQAGGFDDPVFRKTINEDIVVLRLSDKEFYAKEFNINYKDADNFELKVNDKIFVYESPNYNNSFTYTIEGEVNKPGTYPLQNGLSLEDAISLAGGVTELGSVNSVTVSKGLTRISETGEEITQTELVGNISLDFEIADQNKITILPKTNVVRVEGNVYNPGLIAHQSGRGMSMANAIELAGGYKKNSLKDRAYVIRANGEIEKANLFRGRAKRVFPGDSIVVPIDPNPNEFDITTFIADLSTTLANIAAILILVDSNAD